MPSVTLLAHVVLCTLLPILIAQAPPQGTPNTEVSRMHLDQDQLRYITTNSVEPVYPKEARFAHVEGLVKLTLVIAPDGSIADLQPVSGNPLLLAPTMKAVRQWHFSIGGFAGKPAETEVPLTFTFQIGDPPKPAYLHLTNGKVIRADGIREFTDRIEYTVGGHTHQLSPDSVTDINGCARISIHPKREGDCVPAGGPSFTIRAIPLLPDAKTIHTQR